MKTSLYIKINLLLVLIISLSSCTIQKRNYRQGYYFDWNKKNNQEVSVAAEKISALKTKKISLPKSGSENEVLKALTNKTGLDQAAVKKTENIKKEKTHETKNVEDRSCKDTITLYNGTKIPAKITEISDGSIKFKKCDNIDGPLYSIEKNKVKSIAYESGLKHEFVPIKIYTGSTEKKFTGPKRFHWAAITSFGVACLTILIGTVFPVLIIIPGLFAIIFGIIGIASIAMHPEAYDGLAFAVIGLLVGIGAVALILLLLIAFAAL